MKVDETRILVSIFVTALIVFVFYLIGVFIAWNLDPGKWDQHGRAFLVIFTVFSNILFHVIWWKGDFHQNENDEFSKKSR